MICLIYGMSKANNGGTSGANYISVALGAFFVHIVACMSFMIIIYMLNFTNSTDHTYFSGKVFEVFWAHGSENVLSTAGTSQSTESMGAYTVLYTVQTVLTFLYAILPIIVLMSCMAYGVNLANKDTYRQDKVTVIAYSGMSAIIGMTVYTAWAKIASAALFIPSGGDLFSLISDFWQEILGVI
jgi:hypothetical protein